MVDQGIALFVPNLEGGGAERMMVNLANNFADKGYCVDFVLVKKSGPYVKLVDKKVKIHELNIAYFNPILIIGLIYYIRLKKPKVILSAMTYPNIAILIAALFSRVSPKIVISERVTMGIQSKNARSIKEWFKPFFARLTYRFANEVVAISDGVASNLEDTIGLSKSKITTIYNPVVTNSLLNNHPRPDHPFYKSGKKIILAVGRLVPQKGFSTLISAFHALDEYEELRLVILGEGPLHSELQKQVETLGLSDVISFPGFVEDLYGYMQYASVFVLSSLWEGFGNVIVEAMACGCPVVCTDCPSGPAEILANGKFGLLVHPGDSDELALAIRQTLAKPTSKEILRKRALEYKVDTIAKQYLQLMF